MAVAPSRQLASSLSCLAALFLVVPCSPLRSSPDPSAFRFEDPSPYYLYLPDQYSPDRRWPLFVAVHGSADAQACWNVWQPFADEEGFVLLCPALGEPDGMLHQLRGADKLNLILDRIYREYSLQPGIFLTGFSAGGQFVHGYAFHFPSYVAAASVMAPGNYYFPPAHARAVPFAIIVGSRDHPDSIDIAKALAALMQ